MYRTSLYFVVAVCLLTAVAQAAVPTSMTVQGRLTNAGGSPLTGTFTLTFKIYDAANGGTEIWPFVIGQEEHTVTTDADGLWTETIGTSNALSSAVFSDVERWLEITVDDGVNPPTTLPRVKLNTSPYSFRIHTVDGALGGNVTTKVSIGPGHTNTGADAFVAGNTNSATGPFSTIGGGVQNEAAGLYTTIGGGYDNDATALGSTINGGGYNRAHGDYSVIGGGGGAAVADSNSARGDLSTIGGGRRNKTADAAEAATIGGGQSNVTSGDYSVIAGGEQNNISLNYSTVGGGRQNVVNGDFAIVGGGDGNSVNSDSATISGGAGNTVFAAARGATIGGGWRNANGGDFSFIGGGDQNSINGNHSVIGGGYDNQADGDSAVVGGGAVNSNLGNTAVIGGGLNNRILGAGASATIAGGSNNYVSDPLGAIGGGTHDTVTGQYGTVPGGDRNVAGGICSFAAGRRAKARHHGSFVWADYSDNDFETTQQNQFLIEALEGVGVNTNSPFVDLTVNGSLGYKNSDNVAIYMYESGPANPDKMIFAHSPEFPTWGLQYVDNGDRFTFLGNALPAMTVDLTSTGGFVGFGSITAPTNIVTLPNVNTTTGRALGFAWDEYSSRRWKTNIKPLEGSLEKVRRLQGVSYDPQAGGGRQIGLIAEDVGQVVPEVVQYEENGIDAKSIDYSRLVSLLIEGMKEQQRTIEKQQADIENLKRAIQP